MSVRPNIGAVGRRVRSGIGALALLVAVGLTVTFVLSAWTPWRLLVFFPLAASAASFLEVRRRTCVLRAFAGTVEDDAGGTTTAPACDLPSSRRAAGRIVRDAVLVGVAGAAVVAAL